jgi:hypothetical protein
MHVGVGIQTNCIAPCTVAWCEAQCTLRADSSLVVICFLGFGLRRTLGTGNGQCDQEVASWVNCMRTHVHAFRATAEHSYNACLLAELLPAMRAWAKEPALRIQMHDASAVGSMFTRHALYTAAWILPCCCAD